MPLNVYDQLNMKLNGDLQLKPCNDIKVVGYSKQSVSIVRQDSCDMYSCQCDQEVSVLCY